MKDLKKCSEHVLSGCCWNAHAIVGAAFIVVATILTLLTQSGFGILGMFLVGGILWHKAHGCGCCDKSYSKEECCDMDKHGVEKPMVDKSTTKKATVKKTVSQ